MAKKPLPLRIDEGLLARVDEARGDVSRTRWVERALEAALEVLDTQPVSPALSRALRESWESDTMKDQLVDPDADYLVNTRTGETQRITTSPGVGRGVSKPTQGKRTFTPRPKGGK